MIGPGLILKAKVSDATRAWVWALQQLADLMNGLFDKYQRTFKVKTGRGGRRKRRARRSR